MHPDGDPTPKVEKRESQVSKWVAINSKDCETLLSTIGRLVVELAPVLREEPPTDKEGTKPEEQSLVGLANDLREINRGIVRANYELNEILDHLEL